MISSPMKPVARLGHLRLFRAGHQHLYPGLHLWTGKRHVQIWPLKRLGRGSDR